jgi:hypothetical protein
MIIRILEEFFSKRNKMESKFLKTYGVLLFMTESYFRNGNEETGFWI